LKNYEDTYISKESRAIGNWQLCDAGWISWIWCW
jgi:hypothetical protein